MEFFDNEPVFGPADGFERHNRRSPSAAAAVGWHSTPLPLTIISRIHTTPYLPCDDERCRLAPGGSELVQSVVW